MKFSRLILVSLLTGSVLTPVSAEKLHVVTFYNTADESIGRNKKAEMDMMSNEFQSIATSLEKHGYTTDLHFFDASQCKKSVVINTINSLDVAPEDVVFFYYGGHGARLEDDLTDFFPVMCLAEKNPSNWLRLSEVETLVRNKNPRLSIVMSGCCNVVDPSLKFYMQVLSSEGPTMESELEKDGYYHLFNDYKGHVTMTSSKAGQPSYSSPLGGVFCLKLMEQFANIGTGVYEPEWNGLCDNVKQGVESYFSNVKNLEQEPFYVASISHRAPQATTVPNEAQASGHDTPAPQTSRSSIDPNYRPIETNPSTVKKSLPSPDPDYVNKPVETRRTMTINNMESAYADINSLLDQKLSTDKRMELVPDILKKHFAKDAKVKTLGRNMTTVVDFEDAETFLYRLAMSPYISRVNIVAENGEKNELMTVHEIRNK